MTSAYRLAPAVGARLLGLVLVVLAAAVLGATVLAAALRWSPAVLLVVAGIGVLGVVVAGYVVVRRLAVVTLDEGGYRVRLVRGAGVRSATWGEVEDAVTADLGGIDCVVLRLRDGRRTTIPVEAVAADRNAFVTDLREHLRRGEGLRPL